MCIVCGDEQINEQSFDQGGGSNLKVGVKVEASEAPWG